jgi:hypothetical protein
LKNANEGNCIMEGNSNAVCARLWGSLFLLGIGNGAGDSTMTAKAVHMPQKGQGKLDPKDGYKTEKDFSTTSMVSDPDEGLWSVQQSNGNGNGNGTPRPGPGETCKNGFASATNRWTEHGIPL